MKKIITLLSVLFMMNTVQANDELETSMKIIGDQFKIIAVGIQKKNLTEKEFNAVELMQKEIAVSSLIYPDNATTDELKLKYATWMAELMQMALNLEELVEVAMATNQQNMADVTAQFVDINELRKKGHDLFKE